jgi:hypothetical protein
MLLHGAKRLVATLYDLRIAIGADKTPKVAESHHFFVIYDEYDLRIAIGADKTPKVAESHHFFVIYDENTGPVVHLITSHSCLTFSDAINVPETIKADY